MRKRILRLHSRVATDYCDSVPPEHDIARGDGAGNNPKTPHRSFRIAFAVRSADQRDRGPPHARRHSSCEPRRGENKRKIIITLSLIRNLMPYCIAPWQRSGSFRRMLGWPIPRRKSPGGEPCQSATAPARVKVAVRRCGAPLPRLVVDPVVGVKVGSSQACRPRSHDVHADFAATDSVTKKAGKKTSKRVCQLREIAFATSPEQISEPRAGPGPIRLSPSQACTKFGSRDPFCSSTGCRGICCRKAGKSASDRQART